MIKIITNDEQITAKEIEEILAKVESREDTDTFYCNVRTRGKEREAIKHSTFITAREICPRCSGKGFYKRQLTINYFKKYACSECNGIGGRLIGLVRVIGDSTYEYYISEVMVLPEYQRQGIGTDLMNITLNYCKENGFMKIFLTAAPGRESYYKKFGFEKTEYTVMRILNKELEK